MLVGVIATRTPFGQWGIKVVRQILTHRWGAFHDIQASSIDEFREGLAAAGAQNALFASDVLDPEIGDFLHESRSPTIAFIDSPEAAFAAEAARAERWFIDNILVASSTLARMNDILMAPATLVFGPKDQDDARAIVATVCTYLGLAPDDGDTRQLVDTILVGSRPGDKTSVRAEVMAGGCPEDRLPDVLLREQQREWTALYDKLAPYYRPLYDRQPMVDIDVPLELMRAGSQSVGKIDLTGPARCIVWGPYLHIPRGTWSASIEFEVVGNASGNHLVFDAAILNVGIASEARTALPKQGVYSCSLEFFLRHGEQPVELRCHITQGSIEGSFALRSVKLRCLHLLRAASRLDAPQVAALS